MLTSLPYGGYYKAGSAGKRNEWFDVRIFDDDDRELPPKRAGEIVGAALAAERHVQGHWKRPADTLRVMSDMWFHSRRYRQIRRGRLSFFVDRKKDYLRRGGENISSFRDGTAVARTPPSPTLQSRG